MRVMFHFLGELGHHLPSFPLASALRARGHEVVYLGLRDLQREVESRGFRHVPVYDDVWPLGALAAQDRLSVDDHATALAVRRRRMLDEREREQVIRRIRDIDPDVAVVDNIVREVAFIAHHLGLPCLRVSTSLAMALDELPPVTSGLPPDTHPFQLEVARLEAARWRTNPVILSDLAVQVARFGVPPDEVSLRTAILPEVARYPFAVLCEPPFDLPRRARGPAYCALRPELDRRETVADDLRQFVADHRIILVSLGTQSGRYPHSAALLGAVASAMRAHPEWRAVVSASEQFLGHACLADRPGNMHVARGLPQLWLLRRCWAFVTHGGLGSVREAIALRVPMIVVPQQFDQPGNAVRVVHHGVGLCLAPETVTAERLDAALSVTRRDAARFQARLADLDAACQRSVEQGDAVAIVEAAAQTPAPARTARHALREPPREATRLGWAFVDKHGRLAEGGALTAGQALVSPAGQEPCVGVSGWVMSASIGDALARAAGPVAARVRVDGQVVVDGPYIAARALHCLWMVDVRDELLDFADWCTTQALAPERGSDTYAAFQAGVARVRALAAGDASPAELAAARRDVTERFGRMWDRGYPTAPVMAAAHDAARFARWHALDRRALAAAGSQVGTAAGSAAFVDAHAHATAAVEDELARRILARARAAGVDVDAPGA